MEDQYGSDFISITDEEGNTYELEVLSSVQYNGQTYLAVTLADGEEGADLQINILRSSEEDGEPVLLAIEDPQELEDVYSLILDQLYEEEE